jgi:subtilisin family serine protease
VPRYVRALIASLATASLLAGCGGGGGGKTVPPTATPTPTATPAGSDAAAYTCPTNDQTLAVGRSSGRVVGDATRMSVRSKTRLTSTASTGLLAVTYASTTVQRNAASIAQRETAAGANLVRSLTLAHTNKVIHVVAVPATQVAAAEAALKQQPGVVSVAPTGARRRPTTVTAPYWTNDPYFSGFTVAQNALEDNPNASTYEVLPYAESYNSTTGTSVPGQWDMHAIGLGYAFEYSQAGNGSSVGQVVDAAGSASVKIAVIDTGEDPNHPELASKIAYQRCYISAAASPYTQSTSDFETDPDGHGTDVAGIAAAATNNNLGFAGAGGNVVMYGYRVYPTPDDTCSSDSTADDQCDASTVDIASAIDDAVTQHVNVITMSLGGGSCNAGVDDDPTEGAAVAEAVAANVVVVAAAGNSYGPPTEAPGCDSGVIAVGATSLADGAASPNGTGNTLGAPGAPVEYVASYTDYGTNDTYQSPAAWGIVAPGGDPSSDNDVDYLHWIENIWTTTPYMSSASDMNFEGECASDYGTTSTIDCRTLIAGTSMATPHVAGAAALILSVNATYQSPAAMRALLCSTADNINDPNQGCGRLNVYRAMATALHDTPLP